MQSVPKSRMQWLMFHKSIRMKLLECTADSRPCLTFGYFVGSLQHASQRVPLTSKTHRVGMCKLAGICEKYFMDLSVKQLSESVDTQQYYRFYQRNPFLSPTVMLVIFVLCYSIALVLHFLFTISYLSSIFSRTFAMK